MRSIPNIRVAYPQTSMVKTGLNSSFDLINYMKGQIFFIPNGLYNGVIWKGKEIQEGLKHYLDLSPYVVKDNCRAFCLYPKELLGENIAINYFDNAGHTAILPPWLMNDLLIRLRRVNPHVANRFEAELTYQAFYGMEKRKSY